MLAIYISPMNIIILNMIPSNASINVGNFYHDILNIIVETLTYNVSYIFHPYIRNQKC